MNLRIISLSRAYLWLLGSHLLFHFKESPSFREARWHDCGFLLRRAGGRGGGGWGGLLNAIITLPDTGVSDGGGGRRTVARHLPTASPT